MITMSDKEHDEMVQLLFASRSVIEDYIDMSGKQYGKQLLDKIDQTMDREYNRIKKQNG